MKYSELVSYAKEYLMKNEVADYASDSFLLLEHVFGISKTEYLLKMDKDIEEADKLERYKKYLEIRASGKPLQYITGIQDFMGCTFEVNEAVLIPRYDTEVLVEQALKKIKEYKSHHEKISVCDMCTGSGCIGISIAKLGNVSEVTCVDISEAALKVAVRNAVLNKTDRIKFVHSDLFDKISEKYDIIVSNPPYIRTDDIEGLMQEVKLHEPRLALDGDMDGLKFYNEITVKAVSHLKPEGWLMYEIGFDQGKDVSNIMMKNGFANIKVIKDLAGLDRVVLGSLNIGGKEDV